MGGEPAPKMDFQFVNSTLSSPAVPQDLAVRNLIRKQAMRKASAARKRDGNYGRHNLRQYPVFIYDQENAPIEPTVEIKEIGPAKKSASPPARKVIAATRTKKEDNQLVQVRSEHSMIEQQKWLTKHSLSEGLSAGMSAKGYELTSMKTDFNILDLSTLATLHVGRFTRAALSQNPDHLVTQLRAKYDPQFTYLSFLPSRYDQINCLTDSVNCVIARARYIVSPNKNWEGAVITFYLKALSSLQKALDCPNLRYQPEVLCATEILALYELFDPTGETAWVRHTAGAAKLIQLRGPKCYNSEFEKALFMGHSVPIITECLFNGYYCFLEQKAWQKVMYSCIQQTPTLTDRSEIVMSLLMLKAFIPGRFTDVTSIICRPDQVGTPDVTNIASRLRGLRLDFLGWNNRYAAIRASKPKSLPGGAEYDSHCKVTATYLCCMIISTRLLAALSSTERPELERTALLLADQMFELEEEVRDVSVQTTLFLAQTLGVSHSVKMTTHDWDGKGQESDRVDGVIARSTFETWNNICGRTLFP